MGNYLRELDMQSIVNETDQVPLYLTKLEVENYLRVELITIDADGRHVEVTGPNGSGKTSLCRAVRALLEGVSFKETSEPVHHGAKVARIRGRLGEEYIIERVITTDGKSKLTLTAGEGNK